MRNFRPTATAILLACLIPTASEAQAPSQDYFPGAPTGRLYLTLDLKGSGRKDLPNKIEWSRITASRKLEIELAMVMPMKGNIPSVKVEGTDRNNAAMPPGMAEIAKIIEHCKGDEECQQKAIMANPQKLMAGLQASAMQQNDTPYENWIVDRRGACASGTLMVEDQGDGVNIAPPAPAAPYKFKRAGRLELDSKNSSTMDKVCEADIAVDTEKGIVSLRFKGLNVPVPVQLSGQAYTSERSVSFLEGGKVELFDQKVDLKSASWGGQGKVAKAGSVSHNSGQTGASMSGTMTWRFVRNPAP